MEVLFLIFILNNNLQVVGTLSKPGVTNKATAYFNDTLNIDLSTGAETFSFETFGNSREAIHVEGGNYIALRHDGVYKLFQIVEVNSIHSTEHIKEAYCEMAGIELINEILRATNMPATNIKQALTFALQDTDYQIGYLDSSLADVHTIELKEPTKVYNFLQNYIVGLFGAEISFSVEIQGNRVVGKYVNCHAQRGMFNGVRFEYGQNVTRVKKSVDYSELATALVCQGKNGTTISSVEEADKPLGQDWIGDENAYLTYSKNGQHIFDIFKFDTESPAELLREARKELANRCTPKFKYEVDVELLGAEVNIGDTVYVVDNEFNPPLHLSARVSQLQICTTDPTQSKCVLSNYKEVVSKITDDYRDIASILGDKFPIGSNDILDGAISSDKLQEGSVGDIHIQQHSIHTHHLTAKSVTAEIIDAGQIYSEHIIAGAIKSKHLEADSIEAKHIQAGTIEAEHIKSQSIEAEHIKANAIQGNHIQADTIQGTHIQADSIQSTHLQAGSISAIHLQANTITSGSSIIGEGAIGSAQISDLDAGKINAGIIDTSKVTVRGENSNLLIKGNRLQVFDGIGNKQVERVSLGDVYGDGSVYGLIVRGADGKTVLMNENGVTSQGITDGSITNEKISDNSPISGNKLDINSVINRINEDGTEVIKGIKVQVGESNLDAELSSIKSTQGDQGKAIEDNKLSVKAMEDSLKLKVDSQTYQTDKTNMNSKLDKQTSELNVLKGEVSLKVGQTEIDKAVNEVTGDYTSKINEAKAEIKATTDSITQSVASMETTTTKLQNNINATNNTINNLKVGGRNLLHDSSFQKQSDKWKWGTLNEVSFVEVDGRKCCKITSTSFGKTIYPHQSILEDLIPGETYTASAWVKTENMVKGTTNFTCMLYTTGAYDNNGTSTWFGTGQKQVNVNTGKGEWEYVTWTFTPDKDKLIKATKLEFCFYTRDYTGEVYFHDLKLEKGNKATDWTPSVEDIKDQATSIADQTVADLTIGGRNLLPNSGITKTVDRFYQVDVYNYLADYVGQEITISFDAKVEANSIERPVSIYAYQGHGISIDNPPGKWASVDITKNWARYSFVTKVKDFGIIDPTYTKGAIAFYDREGVNPYSIRNIKIELGQKATDWSPAPEDFQSQIDKNSTEITKTNSKVVSLETSVNGVTTKVESLESTTVKLTNTVDNLQVGGRNILKDSKVNIVDSTEYNMVTLYFGDEKPVEGDTYTISIKGQLASTKTAFGIYNSSGSISLTSISEAHNKGGVYTKTFTWKNTNGSVTVSNTFINIYQLNNSQPGMSTIEWVKLEKGNLATDWSPAPEDVQTQLDNQTTEINSTNAKLSTVEANLNGITSTVSTLESTTKTIDDMVTDQEARLKTAESKITDSAITNVVKQSQFIRDLEGNITEVESKYTELKQTVDGFDFTGLVTFSDLNTPGKTVIDAGNITTGYISGDRIKGGTISATDEINFVGGARMFGNTGAYGAGLTISASSYVFNSGEATFQQAVTMQKGLTVTGTATSSTVSTNSLYVYGSSSITGSASVGNSLTVGGNLYGMGNIAIARGSVYIPNHGSSTTSDFLRMGGGFIACTDAGGFHFIPSSASRSIAIASGSVYLPQAGGSHVVEHVRLGMGLIACPSSGTVHFLTAGGVATSLYAKNVIATQSISEVSTLSEDTNALDVVNNAVVVNTTDGFKFAGTKAKGIGGEVLTLTEDKDNNPAVSIDFGTSISTLWKAVQELHIENMKLKEELNSLK